MSWEQLLAIGQANREQRAYERMQPPAACPHDGTPLDTGPRGELHCRMGDYEYPRDGNPLAPP